MMSREGRRSPLQKRSIEKVRLILDAVERLVVIHGTEALTTTHVAEETGLQLVRFTSISATVPIY